jgi:AbrB family looped-hinge helix DNA binding protein
MYTTITSKGQITVPVAARRALGLHEGQKLAIRVEGASLVIDTPPDIRELRRRTRAEAEAKGTWGTVPTPADGWAAHVASRYDGSGRAQS